VQRTAIDSTPTKRKKGAAMEIVTNPDLPKHGQGLRTLVEARKHELELELEVIKKGGTGKSGDIDAALSALTALLTGNLDQIPPVVAQELSRWVESSKFLGTTQVTKPHPVTTAQDLRALIEARHRQHELDLSELKKTAPAKVNEVETALTALKALMAGKLDQIPPGVADELTQLIESNKLLGTKANRTKPE
jgi:hypothetical protein